MSGVKTTDERFMDEVLLHCQTALDRGDCPVAAIVVCEGQVVGVGSNRVATGLDGCTLYSAMEPCPICGWALKEAGIARLVLGACHAGMRRTDYGDYAIETLPQRG